MKPTAEQPLRLLDAWMQDARGAGVADPGTVAFVTVGAGGRPTARTVELKRVEDDVAKRRRQGLVVCRAASPFPGFFDARPGVTRAPTFTVWVACQSLTVRA